MTEGWNGRKVRFVKPPLKVALLIETSNAYARGLLRGIVSYVREHRSWSLYLSEHNRGDQPPSWLASWDGHGIIARIENDSIAAALRRVSLPIVDVSAARLLPALPWFETDDGAIAHLAADHLLERGFKHFGFAGDSRFNWSKWRCEHFQNCVRAAGRDCVVYDPRDIGFDDESRWMICRNGFWGCRSRWGFWLVMIFAGVKFWMPAGALGSRCG
jgi:DNA-binding LacI/PurR family transcriptional regulator